MWFMIYWILQFPNGDPLAVVHDNFKSQAACIKYIDNVKARQPTAHDFSCHPVKK